MTMTMRAFVDASWRSTTALTRQVVPTRSSTLCEPWKPDFAPRTPMFACGGCRYAGARRGILTVRPPGLAEAFPHPVEALGCFAEPGESTTVAVPRDVPRYDDGVPTSKLKDATSCPSAWSSRTTPISTQR